LTLHTLVQAFGQIVRKREGHRLENWKELVAESDKETVLAGLTVMYSNGQVNKLKLIKRQGYGRAGFPLLRQRVLHAL